MIFIPGGAQPAALGKAFAERGIDPNKTKILGSGETTAEQALKSMGDASLGIITAWHYDYKPASRRSNVAFVKLFNEMHKRNPDFFSIGGYDGMHVDLRGAEEDRRQDRRRLADRRRQGHEVGQPARPDVDRSRRPATWCRPSISAGSRRSAASWSTCRSTRSRTSRTRSKRVTH